MSALRELLVEFGIDVDDRQLEVADRSIANTVQGVSAGLAIAQQAAQAVIGVVKGVADFINDTLATGDALADAALAAGMTTDALQLLGFVAGQAGVESQTLITAVSRLQRAAVSSARGGGELGEVFQRLGVNVRAANGQFKDGPTLFREVGLALHGVEDATLRAALAQQVFGRAGTAIAGVFADGAAGIDALTARFAELGGGMTADFAAQASAARDAMAQLDLAIASLKSELVVTLAPAIRDVVTWLGTAVGFMVRTVRQTKILEAATIVLGSAFGALGAVLAAIFSVSFFPLIVLTGILVGIGIAVEDLLVFFQGGKSVIGRFIEALFGVGSSKTALESVRGTVRDIGAAFEVAKIVGVAAWKQINGAVVDFLTTSSTVAHYVNMWLDGFHHIVAGASALIGSIVAEWTGGIDYIVGRLTGLDASTLFRQARAAQGADERQRHTVGPGQAGVGRAGEIAAGFTAALQPRASVAAPAVTVPRQRQGRGVRVNAPINAPITIHGATDARETAAVVRREIRAAQDRQMRDAVAALVPVADGD